MNLIWKELRETIIYEERQKNAKLVRGSEWVKYHYLVVTRIGLRKNADGRKGHK